MGLLKGPVVQFDTADALPDTVTRRGLIFLPGDYPDKEYAMTPEEIVAAAAGFKPVPIDVEHIPTIFDGKLGQLKKVEVVDDGKRLLGEIDIPRWLHEVIGNTPVKVSTQWDKLTKRLEKLALVLDPRITEAAMMSKYVAFAGQRHSAADLKDIQTIHDLTAKQGAACDPKNAKAMYKEEGKSMDKMDKATFLEKMWAFFTGETSAPPATPAATPPTTQSAPPVDAEKESLKAKLAQLEAAQIARDAAAFAEGEVQAGRAYPAEREALIATFTQAAQDDAAHGPTTVTFTASGVTTQKQVNRVDSLKALYAARPAHGLTTERLNPQTGQVLMNTQTTADPNAPKRMTPEEIDAFLDTTALGREALAARKNGGK